LNYSGAPVWNVRDVRPEPTGCAKSVAPELQQPVSLLLAGMSSRRNMFAEVALRDICGGTLFGRHREIHFSFDGNIRQRAR